MVSVTEKLMLVLSFIWFAFRFEASGESVARLRMTDPAVDASSAGKSDTTAGTPVPPVDEEKRVNSLFCAMEPVVIRCLVDRGLKYILPFECLLNRTSLPADVVKDESKSAELMVIGAPSDPLSQSVVPLFPLVLDQSIPGPDMDSCPCNCEIECRSPASLMYQIRHRTACQDCRCLTDDPAIGCQCYDRYDLFFKDLDPYMSHVLQHHVSRRTRSLGPRRPVIRTTDG